MRTPWIFLLSLAAACGDGDSHVGPDGSGGEQASEGGRIGCIETTTPYSADTNTAEGQADQALLDAVAGEHASMLTWQDGITAELNVTMTQARLVKVASRPDPNFVLDIVRQCTDRVRVEGTLGIKTADGRLNETFEHAIFEPAESGGSASAWLHLKASELRGRYVRQGTGAGQLSAVYFSLTLGSEEFSGFITEESTDGETVSMGPSVATWNELTQ